MEGKRLPRRERDSTTHTLFNMQSTSKIRDYPSSHLTLSRGPTHLSLSVLNIVCTIVQLGKVDLNEWIETLIRMGALYSPMELKETYEVEEVMEYVEKITRLTAELQLAQSDEEAREQMAAPRTEELVFPGSKQRAMGHALEMVEDFEDLGIEVEREYVEGDDSLHLIYLHVASGDGQAGGPGGD